MQVWDKTNTSSGHPTLMVGTPNKYLEVPEALLGK